MENLECQMYQHLAIEIKIFEYCLINEYLNSILFCQNADQFQFFSIFLLKNLWFGSRTIINLHRRSPQINYSSGFVHGLGHMPCALAMTNLISDNIKMRKFQFPKINSWHILDSLLSTGKILEPNKFSVNLIVHSCC